MKWSLGHFPSLTVLSQPLTKKNKTGICTFDWNSTSQDPNINRRFTLPFQNLFSFNFITSARKSLTHSCWKRTYGKYLASFWWLNTWTRRDNSRAVNVVRKTVKLNCTSGLTFGDRQQKVEMARKRSRKLSARQKANYLDRFYRKRVPPAPAQQNSLLEIWFVVSGKWYAHFKLCVFFRAYLFWCKCKSCDSRSSLMRKESNVSKRWANEGKKARTFTQLIRFATVRLRSPLHNRYRTIKCWKTGWNELENSPVSIDAATMHAMLLNLNAMRPTVQCQLPLSQSVSHSLNHDAIYNSVQLNWLRHSVLFLSCSVSRIIRNSLRLFSMDQKSSGSQFRCRENER